MINCETKFRAARIPHELSMLKRKRMKEQFLALHRWKNKNPITNDF